MHILNGSYGEGGGAILRLATALALINQESIKIVNIRKKRPNPGLRTQHLMGLHALVEFCGGDIEGDYLGSENIKFTPSNDWRSHLSIKIPTAGSIGLILQTMQLAILARRNHTLKIEFEGGATFGKWAPSIPYVNHVTWDIFRRVNCKLDLTINRHGFYPKGGARVTASLMSPSSLQGLKLDVYNKPIKAKILSFASKHLERARVAQRQSNSVVKALQKYSISSEVVDKYVDADNPGSGTLIFSKTGNNVIAGDFIGERKISAEQVGLKAFERYITTVNRQCTVDPFLADQIIPFLALTSSSSVFSTPYLSNHTKTNFKLVKELLDVTVHSEMVNDRFIISIDA
ncbi:MAG: RNA 3'-terminal phosphate cyclase [Candidatus Hodarchaeota archaeon]